MPNYSLANLAKGQAYAMGMFQRNELRYRMPVTFLEFVRNRNIMFPSHQILRTREDRAIEVNYFARTARALGTGGRTHNHAGARGDSAVLTPTWISRDDVFKNSLKQADNSIYTPEQELANEFGNVAANFAEGLEVLAATTLFNGRSGVNVYTRQGSFNGTQDVFEITETTEGTRGVQISKTVMDANKYQGIPYIAFCDSVAFDKFEKMAFQGAGNSENLTFQFQGVRFVKSLDLDGLFGGLAAPYTDGAWLMVPEGMIGCLDWIPKQNRQGVETKVNMYGSWLNPVDSLLYAVHSYEERSDESGSNGETQDVKDETQISIDLALEIAPSTTADEAPVQAFAFV